MLPFISHSPFSCSRIVIQCGGQFHGTLAQWATELSKCFPRWYRSRFHIAINFYNFKRVPCDRLICFPALSIHLLHFYYDVIQHCELATMEIVSHAQNILHKNISSVFTFLRTFPSIILHWWACFRILSVTSFVNGPYYTWTLPVVWVPYFPCIQIVHGHFSVG